MSQHVDILDQREASLTRPFAGSIALHVGLGVALAGFGYLQQHRKTNWGTENPLGGAIGVDVVKKIPLPNRGVLPNPVAHDTESMVPQKPEKVEKKPIPKDEPDAVPLHKRNQRLRPVPERAVQSRYRPVPERPNQIPSSTGPPINSPMYGKTGVGGIGIGESTVAGRGCGGYLELVRQRIQVKWDAQPVSASISSPVVMLLDLVRAGTVRNVAVEQASRSREIDFAARRAILEAGPFPPFMPNCEGNDARIEVRFEPKR